MNKLGIWGIAIAFAFALALGTMFSADIATAVKPVTEVFVTNTDPIPVTVDLESNPVCPAENVQHWVNARFNANTNIQHNTEPDINNQAAWVVMQFNAVLDNGSVHQLVIDRLNELGYFVDDGGIRPVQIGDAVAQISEFQHSVICAEN